MIAALSAAEVIDLLELTPHPEGGHFRETFRDSRTIDGKRTASTAIYYLLARGERAQWHRVDAAEVWHWYVGAALELRIAAVGTPSTTSVLGDDLTQGERPQAIVPAHAWQTARSLGDWTLTGCTVAPGFEYSTFELAPTGWEPR
jgi:predicted cupin superfamily sugar epimerase